MTAAVLSLLLSCIEPEAIPLVGHACGGTKEGMCHTTGTMCVCVFSQSLGHGDVRSPLYPQCRRHAEDAFENRTIPCRLVTSDDDLESGLHIR